LGLFEALEQLLTKLEGINWGDIERCSNILIVFMWLDRADLVLHRADARHRCQLKIVDLNWPTACYTTRRYAADWSF